MPKLESHLSYRLIDVSTLKELFKYGLIHIHLIVINLKQLFIKTFLDYLSFECPNVFDINVINILTVYRKIFNTKKMP